MSAVNKSIVEIDVKDAKFRDFEALFAKYRAGVNALPGAWGKVGNAAAAASAQAEKGFLNEAHAIAMMTASLSNVVKQQGIVERNARNANGVFKDTLRITGGIVKNITSTTFQLAKWATLGGLAGVATGFFGASSLANAGSNLRAQSQRANVSPGQLRSARNNIGVYGIDTDTLFGNINNAQSNYIGQGTLAQLGISGDDLKKSPGELLPQLLPKMVQMLKQFGGSQQAFDSLGFGNITDFQTMQQLSRLKPAEFQGMMSDYQKDSKTLNIDDDTLRQSQRLATAFHDAADQIENVFIKGLVQYAPQIKELSQNIVTGFGDALKYLNSPTFKQDVTSFLNVMHKLAHPLDAMGDLVFENTQLNERRNKEAVANEKPFTPSAFTPNSMLRSIFGIESSYGRDPAAYNPKAFAKGPYQLSDSVATRYGVTNVMDANDAGRGASRFLDYLSKKYNGDAHKIITAYNLGETEPAEIFKKPDWEKYLGGLKHGQQAIDYIRKYDAIQRQSAQQATVAGNAALQAGGVRIVVENRAGSDVNVTASQLGVQ